MEDIDYSISEGPDTWVGFNTAEYVANNYGTVHDEDSTILERLADFYQSIPTAGPILELGPGGNMYPILAALPKMGVIDCLDPAAANQRYLYEQKRTLDPIWWPYWDLLKKSQPELYEDIDVQDSLRDRMRVWWHDDTQLPKDYYQLASMFFCAESITQSRERFERVCRAFAHSLVPGGYFAAAFMENSSGWDVSGHHYPAVAVNADIVSGLFQQWSDDMLVEHIPLADTPLRPGYTGMVFVTGRRKA